MESRTAGAAASSSRLSVGCSSRRSSAACQQAGTSRREALPATTATTHEGVPVLSPADSQERPHLPTVQSKESLTAPKEDQEKA